MNKIHLIVVIGVFLSSSSALANAPARLVKYAGPCVEKSEAGSIKETRRYLYEGKRVVRIESSLEVNGKEVRNRIADSEFTYNQTADGLEVVETVAKGGAFFQDVITRLYDKNSRLLSETRSGQMKTSYFYNAANRVEREEYSNGNGALLSTRTYVYDAAGKLTGERFKDHYSNEEESFTAIAQTLDSAGRETSRKVLSMEDRYSWDSAGNLKEKTSLLSGDVSKKIRYSYKGCLTK